MHIKITTPTKAYLSSYAPEELDLLRKFLSYTNTAAQQDVKRHYNNYYFKSRNSEKWQAALDVLKSKVHCNLVFEDDLGIYIRPGSIPYLVADPRFCLEITNEIVYPTPTPVEWAELPGFNLYPYQEAAYPELIKEKHGAVSMCTGSGKSQIIMELLRALGQDSVVVVPSASIFNELLEKAQFLFGKNMVGGYGDGKKRLNRKFTIAISDSLVNLVARTPAYEFFKKQKVFIADECFPYRTDIITEKGQWKLE